MTDLIIDEQLEKEQKERKRKLRRRQQFLPDQKETRNLRNRVAASKNTKSWACKKTELVPELKNWSEIWPLPVGFKSVAETASEVLYSSFKKPAKEDHLIWHMFSKSMPFEGNERAAVVFDYKQDDCLITFFGLIVSMHNPYEFRYKFVKSKFDVKGGNPTSKRVQKKVNDYRQWWIKHFEGRAIKTGRRPGGGLTYEKIKKAFVEYEERNGQKPTQKQLAAVLNYSDRHLKDILAVENPKAWQHLKNS